MILSEDKKDIMKLGEGLTPNILKEINFNSSIKEVGHSFHGPFEAKLVDKFMAADPNFTEPEEIRSIEDIKYKSNYINIKFGYKKRGHPNLCSGNRLFDYLAGIGGKSKNIEIDSYYVFSVDADGPKYMFYNVYDYFDLDCFSYDAGTGQFMINENKIKEVYEFNKKFPPLDREATLDLICELMDKGTDKTYELRKKKNQEKRDIIATLRNEKNDYKQGILL
jgi:hypothetical protein